jgi:rod shape-determining protein MreD
MRWISYFILAYLAIGLQVGLREYIKYMDAAPDFVLLVVIFIALNAPRDAALLGCFALGVMQDLLTVQSLGLYALSYSLVGMFVLSTQQIVYREHPLTHFSLAMLSGLMTSAVLLIHGLIHPPREPVPQLFTGCLYTAILAPFVLGGLQRIKRLFGFQPMRRRVKAW